jgi:hypothetical protein
MGPGDPRLRRRGGVMRAPTTRGRDRSEARTRSAACRHGRVTAARLATGHGTVPVRAAAWLRLLAGMAGAAALALAAAAQPAAPPPGGPSTMVAGGGPPAAPPADCACGPATASGGPR